eukprot:6325471-Prymnesium_polylepis.1
MRQSRLVASRQPDVTEILALAIAMLLLLMRDRAVLPGRTYVDVATICKRLRVTQSTWTAEEVPRAMSRTE